MNITKEQIGELNAIIHIQITKDDYEPFIDKGLKDMKRKAKMPGFRPGLVPMGMIRRMYGTQIFANEADKLLNDLLFNYLKENNMTLVGAPLPIFDETNKITQVLQNEYTFKFEIGYAPEINTNITENAFPYYNIVFGRKEIEDKIKMYQSRFGSMQPIEVSETDMDVVHFQMIELDENDAEKENGINKQTSSPIIRINEADGQRAKFIGLKANDTLQIIAYKVFTDKKWLLETLECKEEEIQEKYENTQFKLVVTAVDRFVLSEVNQELFDKVYQGSAINTIEEFEQRIETEIQTEMKQTAFIKFSDDAYNKLMEMNPVNFPVDFLKRWLLEANSKHETSFEQIEKEYPDFEKSLKWMLIQAKIRDDYKFFVDEEDIYQTAKVDTILKYSYYGTTIPEEYIEQFVKQSLENDKERRKFEDMALHNKIVRYIIEKGILVEKDISIEDFQQLYIAEYDKSIATEQSTEESKGENE